MNKAKNIDSQELNSDNNISKSYCTLIHFKETVYDTEINSAHRLSLALNTKEAKKIHVTKMLQVMKFSKIL